MACCWRATANACLNAVFASAALLRQCQRIFARQANGLRFVFIRETKCSDWFALSVANPELYKDGLGYVHFNWCQSVSHFTDPASRRWR